MERAREIAESRPQRGGMWFGLSDGGLVFPVMRPVQFDDIWSRSGAISAEHALALAVVEEALNDLLRYRFARRRREQRLYWEAYDWVFTDDRVWPFSFVNLCEATGLPLDAIRERAVDPIAHPVGGAVTMDSGLGKAA